jgi:methylmalonyl-CoA/ethylmalonyl-CoA epimerase
MSLRGLEHVAVAVEKLEPAMAVWCDRFGWKLSGIEIVEDQQARVARLTKGPYTIELVEPHGPTSTVRKFLDGRGPGLHHVCFDVGDLDRMLEGLKAAGVRLVDQKARTGAHGRRIAFVHPAATGGVLVELSEPGIDPDVTTDPDRPATVPLESWVTAAQERLLAPAAVAELHGVAEDVVKAAIASGKLAAQAVHGASKTGIAMHVVRRSDALAWRPR